MKAENFSKVYIDLEKQEMEEYEESEENIDEDFGYSK